MMAFERLEPFGALQDEFRMGTLAAVMANLERDPEKRTEPFRAEDFSPVLARALEGTAPDTPVLKGEDLSPDELSDLFDAHLFGKVH